MKPHKWQVAGWRIAGGVGGNLLHTQSVSILDNTCWKADKETGRETSFAFFNRPSVTLGYVGKRLRWRTDLYLAL
jgi:hypothetical protein